VQLGGRVFCGPGGTQARLPERRVATTSASKRRRVTDNLISLRDFEQVD